MSQPTQGALIARKVGDIELGFFAAPEYLARHGAPMSFEDLEDHAVIGFDSPARGISDLPGLKRPVNRETFTFRSDSDLAQLAALKAGFGIGVTQPVIARRYGLTRVMSNLVLFNMTTWVVMHENMKGSRRIKLMFDHLVAGLSDYIAEGRKG